MVSEPNTQMVRKRENLAHQATNHGLLLEATKTKLRIPSITGFIRRRLGPTARNPPTTNGALGHKNAAFLFACSPLGDESGGCGTQSRVNLVLFDSAWAPAVFPRVLTTWVHLARLPLQTPVFSPAPHNGAQHLGTIVPTAHTKLAKRYAAHPL